MKVLDHVQLGTAVHYRMFSWRTACGIVFDAFEKDNTQERVTCKRCLRSRAHDYEYLNEYGPYGVGIVREAMDVLGGYRTPEDLQDDSPIVDDRGMRSYTIRMFQPFVIGESVDVFAKLPNDEMAIRLGQWLASWRHVEFEEEQARTPP